jgi:hypothetical protein
MMKRSVLSRLKLLYAVLGAGFSCNAFMQVWMFTELGLSADCIGVLTAAIYLTNLFAVPLACAAYDSIATAWARDLFFAVVIATGGLLHVGYHVVLSPSTGRATLALIVPVVLSGEALNQSAAAMLDTMTLEQLGASRLSFGRVRMWLALVYGLMVWAVGVCEVPFISIVFLMNGLVFIPMGLAFALTAARRRAASRKALLRTGALRSDALPADDDEAELAGKREWKRQEEGDGVLREGGNGTASLNGSSDHPHGNGSGSKRSNGALEGAPAASVVQPAPPPTYGAHVPGAGAPASYCTRLRRVMASSDWRLLELLAVACVLGISSRSLNAFVFLFIDSLGGSTAVMGCASLLQVVCELPFFYYSEFLIRGLGTRAVLYVGLGCYCARQLWYSVVTEPWLVLLAEPLHGITYALTLAGLVAMAADAVPPGLGGTAQGVLSSVFNGLGGVVGAVAGGWLFSISPHTLFCALAALTASTAFCMLLADLATSASRAWATHPAEGARLAHLHGVLTHGASDDSAHSRTCATDGMRPRAQAESPLEL